MMLSQYSYPIICTDRFAQTVAFYEDHFNYNAAFEMKGFVILRRQDWPDMYLGLIDATHSAIPEIYRKPVSGMILNMPVTDVKAAHQEAYWEGLKIVSEPESALCGREHFFIEDPNGILIDVAENIALDKLMDKDNLLEQCMVA